MEIRLREQCSQFTHERQRQMAAAVGQGTEAVALPAPVGLGELVPERRDAGEDGDVMPEKISPPFSSASR